jgi:hypothetical protein
MVNGFAKKFGDYGAREILPQLGRIAAALK